MARPIKPTPTITGQDAKEFVCQENEKLNDKDFREKERKAVKAMYEKMIASKKDGSF